MIEQPLTDADGEVRELAPQDLVHFRSIRDVDPGMIAATRGEGRATGVQPKMHIGLRLSVDVVEAIRAKGRGYNARVEKVLRAALAAGDL